MSRNRELESLSTHFVESIATFTTSPLYRSLCEVVAADQPTLEILLTRRPGQQSSYLLFGAVHYLLLSGANHDLRGFYPSIAGTAAADPVLAGPAFIDFCRAFRQEVTELVRTRLVQSNVVRRTIGLRYALSLIRQQCDGPVHLIEVGASAGVHLHVDRYRYLLNGHAFGVPDAPVTIESRWLANDPPPDLDDIPLIASRTGIDLNPVNTADVQDRRWLRALVWPEDQPAAALLATALECLADDPPQIIAGDAIDVCPPLGRRLPHGEPRVVFHAATRMHVPGHRRTAFDQAIDSIGEDGPLYHVWQEPPSAQHTGSPAVAEETIAFHGPDGRRPRAFLRIDGHLHWMQPIPAHHGS